MPSSSSPHAFTLWDIFFIVIVDVF